MELAPGVKKTKRTIEVESHVNAQGVDVQPDGRCLHCNAVPGEKHGSTATGGPCPSRLLGVHK